MYKVQKVKITLLLLWVLVRDIHAQAPQFTQFYNHPTYHNPALAGEMGHSRISLSHRNQWRGVYNTATDPLRRMPFQTTYASFDTYWEEHKIGIGGYALNDKMGSHGMNTIASLQLSGFIPLQTNEITEHIHSLEGGIGAALHCTRFSTSPNGLDGLKFVDQFTAAGPVGTSIDPFALSGGLTEWSTLLSLGIVYRYFTERKNPSSSGIVLGGALHEFRRDNYPTCYEGFFTYRHQGWIKEESTSFTAHYRHSSSAKQFQGTINYRYPFQSNPIFVTHVGIGFRGTPWHKAANGMLQKDALLFIGGLESEQIRVSISYDLTISSLKKRTSNGQQAGGALEISVTYSIARSSLRRWNKTKKTGIRGSHFDEPYNPKCNPQETRMYMAI